MATPVQIFTTATCPFCHRAKRLFERLGVKYEEVSVDQPSKRAEAKAKWGWPTVPIVVIGGKCVGGYDDVAELERRGVLAEMLARVE